MMGLIQFMAYYVAMQVLCALVREVTFLWVND